MTDHENDFKVVDAGRMGKGLISCKDISKGEFVIKYRGQLITNKTEYETRRITLMAQGKDSYLMEIETTNRKRNWLVIIKK